MTFMRSPQGPVVLTVIISMRETIREVHSTLRGPKRNPPMAMTTSFRSNFKNPATAIPAKMVLDRYMTT